MSSATKEYDEYNEYDDGRYGIDDDDDDGSYDDEYDDDFEYDEDDIEVTFMKIIHYGSSYINKQ
jgi:hypothetical protein